MSELPSTKLDPDAHLILEQPLLRLPHELLRKKLKSAQRQIEITNKGITSSLTPDAKKPDDALASLDATLAKAQNLKRKLEALHSEERQLHQQQKARIEHLRKVHEVQGLGDVKYDSWEHTRLDRLLVDYLLRQGHVASARQLAEERHVADLTDVPVFEECGRIEGSLREGRVSEALAWCGENKQALKKSESKLELELRLQQCVETVREGKLMEAVAHARKYLAGQDAEFGLRAGGLLAHPADTLVEPYRSMYSLDRYTHLATLFLKTHHDLLSLPAHPLLHIALSAGLSALKTPTCHSIHAVQPSTLTGAPVCPICSTELNELAKGVPYAHHTKSCMEDDPVVLPNGRVFGRERLKGLNEKLGVAGGRVRDPTEGWGGEEWSWEEGVVKKVFIS